MTAHEGSSKRDPAVRTALLILGGLFVFFVLWRAAVYLPCWSNSRATLRTCVDAQVNKHKKSPDEADAFCRSPDIFNLSGNLTYHQCMKLESIPPSVTPTALPLACRILPSARFRPQYRARACVD